MCRYIAVYNKPFKAATEFIAVTYVVLIKAYHCTFACGLIKISLNEQ